MMKKHSLSTLTMGLVAIAAAGVSCIEREIEISEFRVELPEPYAPVDALVTGQVLLPTQTGGDITATIQFGDGSKAEASINAQGRFSAGHRYETAGNYTVLVEVTSANGGAGTRSTPANIAPRLSGAEFQCVSCDVSGACNVLECTGLGQRVSFRGRSTGGIGAVRYRWDFGDGTPQVDGDVVTHDFATSGFYTITMLASDSIASTAFSSREVEVTEVTAAEIVAEVPSGTIMSTMPVTLTFYGAGVPPMRVFVSWGDGSSSVVNNYAADGSDGVLTHTYRFGGNYTVTVDAVDALGQTAEDTATVRINGPSASSSSSSSMGTSSSN